MKTTVLYPYLSELCRRCAQCLKGLLGKCRAPNAVSSNTDPVLFRVARGTQNLEMRKVLRGHEERVTGVSWHPEAYSSAKPLLASGAADK